MNLIKKILGYCDHNWEIMNEVRYSEERWSDEYDAWDDSTYRVSIMSRMYVCKNCLKSKLITHEVNDG